VQYYEEAGFARIRFWYEPSSTPASPGGSVPPASAVVPVTGAFQGEYFNNQDLAGTPDLVRTDGSIDFDWGWGEPSPGIGPDYFSVRWTGTFQFQAGTYQFHTYTDDGVRLYVDGKPVLVSWYPMRGTRTSTYAPGAGSHEVRVEYFERTQAARARVSWARADGEPVAPRPHPSMCVVGPLELEAWPTTTRCHAGGWTATIYVHARGGDCVYTYAWEGEDKAGPVSGATTFDLWSPVLGAMVGRASVRSGGQTASMRLYIPTPDDCR
jgi:hypothetical protein